LIDTLLGFTNNLHGSWFDFAHHDGTLESMGVPLFHRVKTRNGMSKNVFGFEHK